jgi:hypothetical protein
MMPELLLLRKENLRSSMHTKTGRRQFYDGSHHCF